jgi:cytochrome P450
MDSNTEDSMDLWTNTFSSDAAFMFIDSEMERHVQAIEDIFDEKGYDFLLSEDAEAELIPRIEIMLLLCEHCGGVLDKGRNFGVWKARHLEMYDDQIDGHTQDEVYKHKRRAVIVDTFDRLIKKQREQWQDDQDVSE